MDDDALPLPPELASTLTAVEGAWEQWEQEPDEVRRLYAQWVSKPRSARTRQERAETTAYYAVHGILRRGIQSAGTAFGQILGSPI
jgi:uncharacterized protein YdeI (YjbR/CyaY-like superfamily)